MSTYFAAVLGAALNVLLAIFHTPFSPRGLLERLLLAQQAAAAPGLAGALANDESLARLVEETARDAQDDERRRATTEASVLRQWTTTAF